MTTIRNTLKALTAAAAILAAAPLAAAPADVVPSDPKAGPESLAAGPDGTLYLGSISSMVVSRAKPGETTARPFIDLTADKGAFLLGVLVDAPTNTLPAFVVTLVLGAAVFSALGLAVSGLVPNAEAAPAVVNASILPLLFFSDVFIPLEDAPEWIKVFGSIFPVKHFSEALQTSFSPFTTGSGFEPTDLAVMAVWGIIGIVLASRLFSWEPRR